LPGCLHQQILRRQQKGKGGGEEQRSLLIKELDEESDIELSDEDLEVKDSGSR
jgi:hypothetical protein